MFALGRGGTRRDFFVTSAATWAAGTAFRATAGAASAANGFDQVLSTDKIHVIDIKADPADLHWLDENREHHVSCDVTIDGEKYKDANFSEKGDIGSSTPLAEKSGFNVRFGKDNPKGMKKLVVNNARQDVSYIHEHVSYEIYRRAGLPAPLTAHATVLLNGKPYGLFVIEEAKDSVYLEKWLGKGNGQGNYYKAAGPVEFATDFRNPLLRSEDSDEEDASDAAGQTQRADLAALADAINTPDADAFVGRIRERLDLDRFVTHYALDALVSSVDGPMFNANNYILYHNPADDRFLMLPHGIDQAFDVDNTDPLRPPTLMLAQRVRAIPALEAQWRSEMNRVMDVAWNTDVLFDRIDQVVSVFQTYAPPKERVADDVAKLLAFAPGLINLLDARKAAWLAQPF